MRSITFTNVNKPKKYQKYNSKQKQSIAIITWAESYKSYEDVGHLLKPEYFCFTLSFCFWHPSVHIVVYNLSCHFVFCFALFVVFVFVNELHKADLWFDLISSAELSAPSSVGIQCSETGENADQCLYEFCPDITKQLFISKRNIVTF